MVWLKSMVEGDVLCLNTIAIRNIGTPLTIKEEFLTLTENQEMKRKAKVASLLSEAALKLKQTQKEDENILETKNIESYFGLEAQIG